jgi:hypothetical protein
MKFAKLILPWLLVVMAVAGAYAFYSSAQNKEAELVKLRAQTQEIVTLRAENAELKKLEVQHDELIRLRKDNEDILRLRNEVRMLRDQTQTSKQSQAARVPADTAQVQHLQATVNQLQTQLAQQSNPEVLTPQQKADQCLNNLRQIDGAKQQWALENQKTFGAPVTAQDILPYLANNQMPVCPTGGSYSTTTVGANPTCTIPGHALH